MAESIDTNRAEDGKIVDNSNFLEKQATTVESKEKDLAQREIQVKEMESEIFSEKAALEAEKESLRKREKSVQDAEIRRDQCYTDEQKKLDDELFTRRQNLEAELADKRSKGLQDISEQLAKERVKLFQSLEREISEKRAAVDTFIAKETAQLETQKAKLEKSKEELTAKLLDMETRDKLLKIRDDELDRKLQSIDDELKRRIAETEKSFNAEKSRLEAECDKLRDSLVQSQELVDFFENLKQKLGDNPETVWLKLKAYEERIRQLNQELMERPTKEMQAAIDGIKKEKEVLEQVCTRLSEENRDLRIFAQDKARDNMRITELEDANRSLSNRNKALDAEILRLEEDVKRMRASYERAEERKDRIKDIEHPYFPEFKERAKSQKEVIKVTTEDKKPEVKTIYHLTTEDGKVTSEIDWLEGIMKNCEKYGLKFPRRILYAYHTSLKTAEWSPLTVLAGVSGTGKSELPKLYAHFGGLNFLSVPVQPNWDSQESLLGFFNSIDNRFDAQPILRLLAQSQKEPAKNPKDYPGLNDVMTLILLDEMNLAHIELYFAEFLSKLESRRGKPQNSIEYIEVKLGSGIPPYPLNLGRNVLWTGTMNQDETTKSLSDKVLDRGIIINFPRPTSLERRKKLNPLGTREFAATPLLPKEVWTSWRKLEISFEDKQINPYKGFIEEMNNFLAKASRALGHRVWQSVEYYMANYPTVRKALADNDETGREREMHTAFEDQLVQKVMPKLRGIETRGKSKTECLDKIRDLLVRDNYKIVDDFDSACEFGYGQFMWNSANYIEEEDASLAGSADEEILGGRNKS
jgi:hypothetical protein